MIFLMRGTTCSGKDTFVEQHFHDTGSIFSSDQFRKMVCGDIHAQQFNKQVFDFMHSIMDFRLANKPDWTVYNATNLRIRDASGVLELAKKHVTPVTVISIYPPSIEELKERNMKRYNTTGFFIPENIIEKHHARYFSCMDAFHKEAHNNALVKFVEIDQDYEVIDEI